MSAIQQASLRFWWFEFIYNMTKAKYIFSIYICVVQVKRVNLGVREMPESSGRAHATPFLIHFGV